MTETVQCPVCREVRAYGTLHTCNIKTKDDLRAQLSAAQAEIKELTRLNLDNGVQSAVTAIAQSNEIDRLRKLLGDFIDDMRKCTRDAKWMVNGDAYKAASDYLNPPKEPT